MEKNYMKKYLIISDIHGDYESFSKIIDLYNNDKFKDLLILGDLYTMDLVTPYQSITILKRCMN